MSNTSEFEIRKEQTITDSITHFMIDWLSDDIRIFSTDLDDIRIVQKASSKFPEGRLFHTDIKSDELRIVDGRKETIKIGFLFHRSLLEVYLPVKVWNSVRITTVGGGVYFNDISAVNCKCRITSGRAEISGHFKDLDLGIVGSSVTGENLIVDKLHINSTSSKLELSGDFLEIDSHNKGRGMTVRSGVVPEKISSVGTGAKVIISIPNNDGFVFKFKKLSGNFKSDFPLISEGKQYTYLHARRCYSAEVRGGEFSLRKQ
ncbi:DUF4097 family beta strand repeat-containing protein [Paenibacillus sp. Marseille-Q4541]|uniref:DUF4097 family beta strand repeat-containing protein n=1 Tax=Paenibacillus sp. Marseille-Q4541 TaxID=2831522 RepID=UPI001BAE4160|nr:DUF4097 family beta strand repeat-containing protein [Paenibacillus sp. Marseille-Q4541]